MKKTTLEWKILQSESRTSLFLRSGLMFHSSTQIRTGSRFLYSVALDWSFCGFVNVGWWQTVQARTRSSSLSCQAPGETSQHWETSQHPGESDTTLRDSWVYFQVEKKKKASLLSFVIEDPKVSSSSGWRCQEEETPPIILNSVAFYANFNLLLVTLSDREQCLIINYLIASYSQCLGGTVV